ncbi:helix-turn-helix domain-containing protein [Aliivibrio logei]|uniref:helix-turn-helix domain-containing protein n=1 Tax=Aliivibrio logei TaxID=688 RepID=UPI0003C7ABEC|nr:helix-turn-helix transcriptional regulator [Aliivibrio logei]
MLFGKRLKSVIKEERFTQKEFAAEMDIPLRTIEEYVASRSKPSGDLFMKLSNHEKFRKYTMWLLSGTVEPGAGQVCPAFSTQEKCGLTIGNGDIQKKA